MNETTPILIATEELADAQLVKKLLDEEFDDVVIASAPEQAVQDFETHRPAVLILAFDTLEKAERYYLGLYRLSATVHTIPHYTILLCNGNDLWKVYALCKKQHFDDYVLFWPITNDAPRLRMAVHHALRQRRAAGPEAVTTGQLAAQARRLGELETQLMRYETESQARAGAAGSTLVDAEQAIHRALDALSEDWPAATPAAPDERQAVRRAIEALKSDGVGAQFRTIEAAVTAMGEWGSALQTELAAPLASARTLRALADQIRPLILLVDDDEFQHKLVKRLLAHAAVDLIFAASGTEALAALRRHRPELILMDVELPDIDGIETTRRIKAIPHLADIPIVMITGHSEKSVVVRTVTAGAAGFLVKPYDRPTLMAKLGQFLDTLAQ